MRYLGIDYGTKKVGLALSDEAGTMGFPHATISNLPRLLVDLRELIERQKVHTVVIGDSRTLTGIENPIAAEARALGDALAAQTGVTVVYESEVYTSAQARRAPAEPAPIENKKGNPRRARVFHGRYQTVDASAAALILTSYLSHHHG